MPTALMAAVEGRTSLAVANSHEIDMVLGLETGSRETQVFTRAAQRTGLAESVIERMDRILH